MTRLRLAIAVLALMLTVVAVRLVWTSSGDRERDRDGVSAARVVGQGARVAVQVGLQGRTAPVQAPVIADVPGVHAPVAPTYATTVERRFAASGASAAEIDVMKTSWPDWETKFSGASDDMVQAHLARVKPLVPVVIPNEISHVAAVNLDAARSGGSVIDDIGHSAGGVMDDVGRAGGGVVDDVARGGASMLDDVLRVLGIGGAAAGAAGAAALSKKKK